MVFESWAQVSAEAIKGNPSLGVGRQTGSCFTMSLCKTPLHNSLESGGMEVAGVKIGARENPLLLWLAGLGASSRPTMLFALRRAVASIDPVGAARLVEWPWGSLRHSDVLRMRVGLEGACRPASGNLSLAAVKGVARAAWRLRLMDREELERIRDVKGFPHRGETSRGRFVPRAERTRLFAFGERRSTVDTRNRALLAVLLGGGLRRSEAASLTREHLGSDGMLRVRGKGGRVRRVPLSRSVAAAVADWLVLLPADYRFLFPPLTRGGKLIADRQLSGAAIADLLARRARKAGVAEIKPHDLRRTCASDCLENGADLLTTQQLLGHANPATTMRYDLRSEKGRRTAVETVFVPV